MDYLRKLGDGYPEIISNGSVVASGSDRVDVGRYFKVSFISGFDSVRVEANGSRGDSAIAIDNLRVRFSD